MSFLLLESTGDKLLLENGIDRLLLESTVVASVIPRPLLMSQAVNRASTY